MDLHGRHASIIDWPAGRRSAAGSDRHSRRIPGLNNTITVAEAFAAAAQNYRSGQTGKAEALCRQIIAAQPEHADALHLLGVIAHQTQHLEAAAKLLGRAIAANGGVARYHDSLGNVLRAMKRNAEAAQSYRRAIELDPASANAHFALGQFEYDNNDFESAAKSFLAVIAASPESATAHARYANSVFQLGRVQEAIESYRRALALNPNDAMTHTNLGLALHDLGLVEEAVEHCQRAVALRPNFPAAHNNLGLALLLKGDYAAGLQHHEWRWQVAGLRIGGRRFAKPAWRGEPLNGETILLHSEQGAGDTLQFLRYAPLVAARGGRVVIEVAPELKRLAVSVKDVAQVVVTGEPLPEFAQHCPFLSLPLAFGTTLATIPHEVPYLAVPEPLLAEWRARLPAGAGPRVGLVWAGRAEHRRDRERSMALATLAPLADTGATFYALQKGPAAAQAKSPPAGMVLHDLSEALTDFADTAAAMAALDLVISVDTSPAHLAGALARPVWLLLTHGPDWRWLLGREDNPWYPTARLFRQSKRGDWASAVERAAAELKRYASGDAAALVPQKPAE
jgi:tetratricopeptide (TPR) repeat protein